MWDNGPTGPVHRCEFFSLGSVESSTELALSEEIHRKKKNSIKSSSMPPWLFFPLDFVQSSLDGKETPNFVPVILKVPSILNMHHSIFLHIHIYKMYNILHQGKDKAYFKMFQFNLFALRKKKKQE